jgi:predicted amidohydrolase YtcJ
VADLILFNANVITMDPAFPKAQFVAVKNGKIFVLAQGDDFKELRHKNTKVIDCKGRTVLPGFIDAHLHFHGMVESLVTLNLEPRNRIRSISDIQDKIKQASKRLPAGTWIRGRGYHEFDFAEKRHPTRWDLDAATPFHPIKLTHRSGRAHVLNSLALRIVGISNETPDPPGGLIDRHVETGEPTGVLYGMGDELSKAIPPIDSDQMESGVKLANTEMNSLGITSFQDASSNNNLNRWEMFRRWKGQGFLKSRINMMLGIEGFGQYQDHLLLPHQDEHQLNLRGVKIIVHETTGELSPNQEELNEIVLRIHRAGCQAVLHAIEERTIEASCRAIEYTLKKFPPSDHRHRIEHCSVCPPSLAKRMASLGVMVVTQPSFIYYHGERYLKTVPDSNLKHLYPIATLFKSGVEVVASSDCPVVLANPLMGIYSAASRRAENGDFVLPDESVSPLEALRMYTLGAAKATFEEGIKGSLAPGKLADLVVLNGDPTKLPIDEIKNIEVEMTIVDGEVVWEKIGLTNNSSVHVSR